MPLKLKLTAADVADHAEDAEIAALVCTGESSGLDVFSPEERARRELAAVAKFDDEIAEHEQLVEAVSADVEQELGLIEDIDPRGLDELAEEDVTAVVSTWLPIAERDVRDMPPTDLERRVRTVMALGDRRRMSAYAIALRGRIDASRKQYADVPIGEIPAAVSRERAQLAAIGEPLEAALVDPKRAERKKAAQAQQDRVRELRRRINEAKSKAHRQRAVDMAASPMAQMGRL